MSVNELELRKSWGTVLEMLADRGLDPVELRAMSAEDFATAVSGKYVFHIDAPSIGHRIIYELSSRFKSGNIKKLLEKDDVSVFIIIVREQPTSTALKGLEAAGRDIQFFNIAELQFNVSKHMLVPPHVAIRDEKTIEELVAHYQVKSRFHFPLILSTDPMARYLALKHGQAVQITRASPSAGMYTLYRCCMKA
jgi:DNA-directed RNA polymerase subunit H (RpoH/RPB5)